MNTLVLGLAFATTSVVAGMIVLAFSLAIDEVLLRLTSVELAAAWARYAKFGVFAFTFTGGLRLKELEALAASGSVPLEVDQALIEVFKSLSATLSAGAWSLLLFFGCGLAAYGVLRVYENYKTSSPPQRSGDRHSNVPAARF